MPLLLLLLGMIGGMLMGYSWGVHHTRTLSEYTEPITLVRECEAKLPRNQYCVLTAIPEEVIEE